jgi:hypothetical protein
MAYRVLNAPKYEDSADWLNHEPKKPTEDDVEKEMEKLEEETQKLKRERQARMQQLATMTVEERLQKLEAYVESKMHKQPLSRDDVRDKLRSEWGFKWAMWKEDDPDVFRGIFRGAGVGTEPSVVNSVFSKFYKN